MVTVSVSLGVENLIVGDNILINNVSFDRQVASSFLVHNTTGAAVSLSLYASPDITSASGDLVYFSSIAANTTNNISELVGQSFPASLKLVAVASAVGLNSLITVNNYA